MYFFRLLKYLMERWDLNTIHNYMFLYIFIAGLKFKTRHSTHDKNWTKSRNKQGLQVTHQANFTFIYTDILLPGRKLSDRMIFTQYKKGINTLKLI
jgi:hypothetical protein